MKTKITTFLLLLSFYGFSQKYLSRDVYVSFFSSAPLENIEAVNKSANAILDSSTGKMAFKVLIKSFDFKKVAMQKHFNIKYMESDTYPNAIFRGIIKNFKEIDLNQPSEHKVEITGNMSIHGVEKNITVQASLEKKASEIVLNTKFPVNIEDYNVKVPGKLVQNISEVVDVAIKAKLKPIK